MEMMRVEVALKYPSGASDAMQMAHYKLTIIIIIIIKWSVKNTVTIDRCYLKIKKLVRSVR